MANIENIEAERRLIAEKFALANQRIRMFLNTVVDQKFMDLFDIELKIHVGAMIYVRDGYYMHHHDIKTDQIFSPNVPNNKAYIEQLNNILDNYLVRNFTIDEEEKSSSETEDKDEEKLILINCFQRYNHLDPYLKEFDLLTVFLFGIEDLDNCFYSHIMNGYVKEINPDLTYDQNSVFFSDVTRDYDSDAFDSVLEKEGLDIWIETNPCLSYINELPPEKRALVTIASRKLDERVFYTPNEKFYALLDEHKKTLKGK